MLSAIVVGDHLQHAACGDAIEHVSARNVVGVVSLVEMGCRRKSEQSNGNSNKVSTIAGAAKLTVGRWFKRVGDPVSIDEPLVEIDTYNLTHEIRAPATGILSKILVMDGGSVEPGTIVGAIDQVQPLGLKAKGK